VSDRLNELKRQRALVAGHLQWLDQEIAACAPTDAAAAPATPPPPPPPLLVPAPPTPLPEQPRNTDPGLVLLQDEERRRGEVSKSGCWIVFSVLLLLLVSSVSAVIWFKYR
jgi:hypothetical protein